MMKSNIINILMFADDSYYKQARTMLYSLFSNNKSISFLIFLYGNISEHNKRAFSKLATKNKSHIDFSLRFPNEFKKHIQKNDKTSIYLNKFIFFYLPNTIERVLYLDCDLVVNSNISDFYFQDFHDKSIIVTKDLCLDWCPRRLPNDVIANDYFNAGVMLINISNIKSKYSIDVVESYLNKYRGNLPCDDQDILNMMLFNDKKVMPDRRYNYCVRHKDQEIKKDRKTCVIFHYYYQNNKPWKFSYYNRNGFFLYWKYAWRIFGVGSFTSHYICYLFNIVHHYYLGRLKSRVIVFFRK